MLRRRLSSWLGFSWLIATATFPSTATASTAPGTLTLSATFEAISVRATFSGDTHGNNSATLKFRKQGDSAWLDAFAPIVDRRASIDGVTNPHANQARGSIVGLTPGTTYEVTLSFVDPDGVSGSELTGTVTTIASTPPLGGKTLYVDDVASNGDGSQAKPFNSITAALAAAAPGDTIRVAPGTYPPFSITQSGSANGYIAIVGEARDQVFIDGGSGDNIQID